MATQAEAFSPKEFTCWIKAEATVGTSVLATSGMSQLDVDSVGYPSLNVNQALDVRSGAGRTFKDEDFFQDNVMRIAEISLSNNLLCNLIKAVASKILPLGTITGILS